MKNLLIIISAYLNERDDYYKMMELIVYKENYELIIINDNPNFEIKGIVNNEKNKSKFTTILENINIKNDFSHFITIDPDDILNNAINWASLNDMSKYISSKDRNTFFINSYWKTHNNKTKYIHKPNHIFNPNSIYPVYLIKENISYNNYINYMEDLALLLVTTNKNTKFSRISFPFYNYTYGIGLSSERKNRFENDLKQVKLILKSNPFRVNSIIKMFIYITRIFKLKLITKHI